MFCPPKEVLLTEVQESEYPGTVGDLSGCGELLSQPCGQLRTHTEKLDMGSTLGKFASLEK